MWRLRSLAKSACAVHSCHPAHVRWEGRIVNLSRDRVARDANVYDGRWRTERRSKSRSAGDGRIYTSWRADASSTLRPRVPARRDLIDRQLHGIAQRTGIAADLALQRTQIGGGLVRAAGCRIEQRHVIAHGPLP